MSKRRPRLRTILVCVNLLILLLPLAGIAVLRLYENELIRGTEAQLLLQGAFVREMFRTAHREVVVSPEPTAHTVDPNAVLLPELDVSRDAVLPPAPPAVVSTIAPDPAAALAGTAISASIEAAARATLTGIRVVDPNGIVVASTGEERLLSLAEREEVTRALRGERVSLLRQRVSDEPRPPLSSMSRGQRYRVFVALPVEDRGRILGAVVLSRTPPDIIKALYLNREPLLIGAAGLILVVVLVSTLTSVTIVRPARALIEQADRVARGERGAVVEIGEPGTAEMARLAKAIGHMAHTLQERADYISSFASHVSHEFKTPLASIRGTVELLRDHLQTMTAEERDRFLTILAESTARLERLVRRLLDLARADVLAPGDELTEVAATIESVVQSHRAAGLDITLAVGTGLGRVRMATESFVEIFSNLFDNARIHGGADVKVHVSATVDASRAPSHVVLTVADDGPGISEANASRIFTPFFTTARERGGTGLGLSIVRVLLAAHGGTIELDRDRPGTTFVLRIPCLPWFELSTRRRP